MTSAGGGGNQASVTVFRHLLTQRRIALLLCAGALLLKLLVPSGYMIVDDHGRIGIAVCSGLAPQAGAMAMPGMDGDMAMMHGAMADHGGGKDHGRAEMPCAFAGLAAQVIGAVDIVLLTIALAIVAAMALRGGPGFVPQPASYLRPPLRGPPLTN